MTELPYDLLHAHLEHHEPTPYDACWNGYQHPGYEWAACSVCGTRYLRGKVQKGLPSQTCGMRPCMTTANEWPPEGEHHTTDEAPHIEDHWDDT